MLFNTEQLAAVDKFKTEVEFATLTHPTAKMSRRSWEASGVVRRPEGVCAQIRVQRGIPESERLHALSNRQERDNFLAGKLSVGLAD
jgi:hypothetical protein